MPEEVTKEQLLDQYESLRVQENVLAQELLQAQARVAERQENLEAHRVLVADARQRLLNAVETSISDATQQAGVQEESVAEAT